MRIRPFAPSDTDAVVALWERCELTRPWNDPRADIARKLTVQPELFLVGELDAGDAGARLVASVMAGYDGHRGWMNYLAVDPAERGRGLGRTLVTAVEERLTALGCPKANLQVRAGNETAVGFYRAIGYDLDGTIGLGKRLIPDT
ncbi:MAG: GNAT family acetyltransferase [Solirubrobacteraceae bacterium]|nr:GNAT family acetyltransferase [Patulibacter sp.]